MSLTITQSSLHPLIVQMEKLRFRAAIVSSLGSHTEGWVAGAAVIHLGIEAQMRPFPWLGQKWAPRWSQRLGLG